MGWEKITSRGKINEGETTEVKRIKKINLHTCKRKKGKGEKNEKF